MSSGKDNEFELLLSQNRRPTATERGTATHLFFQYCDYRLVMEAGIENEIAVLVVSIIVGILFGLLFTKIFKALYILETSFSGTILAGFSLGVVLCPETFNYMFAETMKTYYSQLGAASADIQMALEDVGLANLSVPASDMGALLFGALIILGIVVGIVATIVQFKKCKEI
jgi:hypothetical protein